MTAPRKRAPSPLLLDPGYWRSKLEQLQRVPPCQALFPRPDLSSAAVEVIEWRLKAHDGVKLWGLRARSTFHPQPKGARIREVSAAELPQVDAQIVAEGKVEYVLQTPAGRRLEDRVLDLVRVYQCALAAGTPPPEIHVAHDGDDACPDEVLIASSLFESGIC
jgi:hypothetical protein